MIAGGTHMTFGEKIQKLRKQQGLSQEALAEKVTVTRQTISKWELGQSTPDLEYIVQLSGIFGVSADYLIRDELVDPDALPLQKKKGVHLTERVKRYTLAALSAAALTAICVCLICDYFTSEYLSWSLVVAVSIVVAWCLCVPALTAKNKIVLKTLLTVSIIPFPLLALLGLLLKRPIVFTLGVCVSLVALAATWIIYGIFCKWRHNLWRGFGFAMLVLIPTATSINHIAAYFVSQNIELTSDIFNGTITLVLAVVCFGMDYLQRRRNGEKTEKI
jgi:transcriptional regulator with XRE-family HTH domain